MKKELICIVCPNSCSLTAKWDEAAQGADGSEAGPQTPQCSAAAACSSSAMDPAAIRVTGNKCPKGKDFAIAELTAPLRTISTTVATRFEKYPVLPVRVSCDIPKGRIFDVMAEINRVTVDRPVRRGEAVIENVLGLGADVIATSDVLYETYGERDRGQENE